LTVDGRVSRLACFVLGAAGARPRRKEAERMKLFTLIAPWPRLAGPNVSC